jgi:DNA-binding beta-propeller fold protein YncE
LHVAVAGAYAYVADYEAGLQIIDVSDPAAPVRVGGYDTSGGAYGVAVAGRYVYVADDGGGLVILLPQCGSTPADSNCDGAVSVFDIDPFVQALTDRPAWEAAYACDYLCANDCNQDGAVNAFDIDPFILLLTGGR